MARLGRYFLPDQPLHVIQRGNNRDAVFFCDADYARYRAGRHCAALRRCPRAAAPRRATANLL
jgi:REP element-mobilizing transposase RayT